MRSGRAMPSRLLPMMKAAPPPNRDLTEARTSRTSIATAATLARSAPRSGRPSEKKTKMDPAGDDTSPPRHGAGLRCCGVCRCYNAPAPARAGTRSPASVAAVDPAAVRGVPSSQAPVPPEDRRGDGHGFILAVDRGDVYRPDRYLARYPAAVRRVLEERHRIRLLLPQLATRYVAQRHDAGQPPPAVEHGQPADAMLRHDLRHVLDGLILEAR